MWPPPIAGNDKPFHLTAAAQPRKCVRMIGIQRGRRPHQSDTDSTAWKVKKKMKAKRSLKNFSPPVTDTVAQSNINVTGFFSICGPKKREKKRQLLHAGSFSWHYFY